MSLPCSKVCFVLCVVEHFKSIKCFSEIITNNQTWKTDTIHLPACWSSYFCSCGRTSLLPQPHLWRLRPVLWLTCSTRTATLQVSPPVTTTAQVSWHAQGIGFHLETASASFRFGGYEGFYLQILLQNRMFASKKGLLQMIGSSLFLLFWSRLCRCVCAIM